jgi:putative membrane protein insertion efficiency factor
VNAVLVAVLLRLLRAYQLMLSPFLGQNCRFYPTCSNYALEAIGIHGARAGFWMAVKRVCKCHPWHPGGVDLVPPKDAAPGAAPASPKTPTTACGCNHS